MHIQQSVYAQPRHPDSVTTARGLSNGGFHFTDESANDLLSSVWPNESMKTFDVGDLDRDGDIDIMALGGAGIAMFRNQGGNTNHWIDIPSSDKARYDTMFQETRIRLRDENKVYDKTMLRMMRKIRCKVDGSRAECTTNKE